jgi:micrococcal nuclease
MSRQNIKLISVVFFMLSAAFYLLHENHSLSKQNNEEIFSSVKEVHDGDTISAIINQKKEKVRLIGIDAPEIGQNPWGMEAKKYLETLLSSSGWKVKLEFDIDKRDKYGRILAYLWTTRGEMVNLLMLKSGNALLFTLPPNVKYVNDLRTAQREAKDGEFGIWGEKGMKERPGAYRREHPL